MSKYFHSLEFLACKPSCSITQMDSAFLEKMDALREACGFPLVVNCAYRSEAHDIAEGRSGKSYHTQGRAMDIRCHDGQKRAIIVRKALEYGLSVGVYSGFLHIDDRLVENQVLFYGF